MTKLCTRTQNPNDILTHDFRRVARTMPGTNRVARNINQHKTIITAINDIMYHKNDVKVYVI